MGRGGQHYDPGPIFPPEEEFDQLHGNQRAAGRVPDMDRKVGSDEWEGSVPSTCDWRKAPGIISSVKDQVSASQSLARSSPSGGSKRGRGKAQIPYQLPLLSPLANLLVLLGYGGCGQHRSPVGH